MSSKYVLQCPRYRHILLIPESLGHRSFGRKMTVSAVRSIYTSYKTRFFPRLLEDPNISPEDKRKISELLKKPWSPYIQSALNTWNTHLIPQLCYMPLSVLFPQ